MKTAIKIAGLCLTLALASCGGGDSTTSTNPNTIVAGDPTAPTGSPAATQVVANTGTVTVTTEPNNVVSIGASGTNFKTADATSKVVFAGLSVGAVDVHVFSADGYSATSYYGINSDKVNAGGNSSGSVVDIYVQATNAVGFTQYYLDDGAGNIYYGNDFAGNGNITFNDWNDPAGTVLNATIYAGTGSATSTAGNSVSGEAELINLGNVSVTTTAVSGAAQANLTATFSATPATPPNLVTINSITQPVGHAVGFVQVAGVLVNSAGAAGTSPTFPDTIAAAHVPSDMSYYVASANAAGTQSWTKSGAFVPGGTLNVAATMSSFPSAVAQTGATIAWTSSTDAHPLDRIQINDAGFTYFWTILTPSGTTSVTLPTLPTGVASPLTAGVAYSMDVSSYKFAATYAQVIAAPSLGSFDLEGMSARGIVYTR